MNSVVLRFGLWLSLFSLPASVMAEDADSKIETLLDSVWMLRYTNPSKGLEYADSAFQLAEDKSDDNLCGLALRRKGILLRIIGDFDGAKNALLLGLNYTAPSSKERASTLNSLGLVYKKTGNLAEALVHFRSCGQVYQSLENQKKMAQVYGNMGNVFQQLGYRDSAWIYLTKSVEISQSTKDSALAGSAYMNLGNFLSTENKLDEANSYYKKGLEQWAQQPAGKRAMLFNNMGLNYMKSQKLDSSIWSFKQSLDLKRSQGLISELTSTLSNLGSVYLEQRDWNNAEAVLLRGYEVADSLNDSQMKATVSSNLGELYLNTNSLKRAGDFLYTADSMAHRLKLDWLRHDNLKRLATWAELRKDYSAALVFLNKHQSLHDSLQSLEQDAVMEEMQARFNARQQQRSILLLKQEAALSEANLEKARLQKRVYLAFTLLGLILLFIVYFVLRNSLKQQKLRASLAERETDLQRERIDGILEKQEVLALEAAINGQQVERNRLATELHDNLGSHISALQFQLQSLPTENKAGETLKKLQRMTDDAYEEIRRISRDMTSEQVKQFGLETALQQLGKRVSNAQTKLLVYTPEHPTPLYYDLERDLYRSTQELVSNALKYAKASQVVINLTRHPNQLTLMVEDNGLGFDQKLARAGLGLKNIEKRMKHNNGTFSLDTSPGKGTTAILEVSIN